VSVLRTLLRYLPVAILAVVWELVVRLGLVSDQVLPALSDVAAAWWRLMVEGDIPLHAKASFARAAYGLAIAAVVGGVGGLAMVQSRAVYRLLNPILQMLYPIPKSALIPLVLIFFGIGSASKVFLIALGCTLPILLSTLNGARGVDRSVLWSAQSLGASRLATLWEIRVPAAMPEILAGARTATAFCFILLVSSELLISRDGLGYLIANFGEAGVYPEMFAVILTVAFTGFCADRLLLALSRFMLRWQAPS